VNELDADEPNQVSFTC